jgi:hypothetical protein
MTNIQDLTTRWNTKCKCYVIWDAWCIYCQKPPGRIKHAGWFWNLKQENPHSSRLLRLVKHIGTSARFLILVSNDSKQTALYERDTSYIPDKHDISIEYRVGR